MATQDLGEPLPQHAQESDAHVGLPLADLDLLRGIRRHLEWFTGRSVSLTDALTYAIKHTSGVLRDSAIAHGYSEGVPRPKP